MINRKLTLRNMENNCGLFVVIVYLIDCCCFCLSFFFRCKGKFVVWEHASLISLSSMQHSFSYPADIGSASCNPWPLALPIGLSDFHFSCQSPVGLWSQIRKSLIWYSRIRHTIILGNLLNLLYFHPKYAHLW